MPRSASPAPRRRSARSRSASPAPQREVALSVARPVKGATMALNCQRFTLFFLTCITELALCVFGLHQLCDYFDFECPKGTSDPLVGLMVWVTRVRVNCWVFAWLDCYDGLAWWVSWSIIDIIVHCVFAVTTGILVELATIMSAMMGVFGS